jgi:DNA segregation ATPase FtsK/SpoIIIE-like protein
MGTNAKLFEQSIDELATKVEEGARASRSNIERFIEPAEGTLRRAKLKRHHLVFGRRGSGKSSLLYKAGHELEHAGHPIAMVDLEPFKGHHYPDVLISVLIATFRKYETWLITYINNQPKCPWWTKLQFWKKISQPKGAEILPKLRSVITDLGNQLFLADNASLIITNTDQDSREKSQTQKARISARQGPISASIEEQIAQKVAQQSTAETREETRRSKQDFLHRQILNYQHIFQELGALTEFAVYLFLDDLYHLHRGDQANLLDYFHRVAKNNNLWLKIGTIKNRSTWYIHGPQPIGLKIGDDADDINLDLTLENWDNRDLSG